MGAWPIGRLVMQILTYREEECPCAEANCRWRGNCVVCCKHHHNRKEAVSDLPFCMRPENEYAVPAGLESRVVNKMEQLGLAWMVHRRP